MVLSGVLAPRVASIFRVRRFTRLRDRACRWSAQNAEQRCLALKKKHHQGEKKRKSFSAAHNCSYHAFTCVYMLASGCFPVCLATHIGQCIQLLLLMEDVPREKSLAVQSSSSDFTLMMLFVGGAEEELQCKNQRILVQD